MPRQPRLVLPGVALHLIQRGNNRGACFVGDNDYLCYLTNLREISARHHIAVHAYCLMTNHVHLLLTPEGPDDCANLMRDLGQQYVQYYNRRHQRTGTLWEGRFRSCLVESSLYVLACHRYIELNPVRAGVVNEPSAYIWSSHAANTGVRVDSLLSPHPDFVALEADPERRNMTYRQLFGNALEDSMLTAIREATHGNLPLGSEPFKCEISAGGRKIAHGKPGRPANKPSASDDQPQREIGL
jgi:putative transposase